MFVLGIRNNKDLFLLLFSVYGLASSYELEVSNLYELNLEGGGATQAIFIAAVSTIIALMFFWRKRDRTEFKLYIRSGFIL